MAEERVAAHPVWSSDNEGLKQEFRSLEERVRFWQNAHSKVEGDAERLEDRLDALRKGLQGQVEHQHRVVSSAESDAIHAGAVEKKARLIAVIAKTTADRLQALLDSGGEK